MLNYDNDNEYQKTPDTNPDNPPDAPVMFFTNWLYALLTIPSRVPCGFI